MGKLWRNHIWAERLQADKAIEAMQGDSNDSPVVA